MKPRRPSFLKNHYYHFYNRGIDRKAIFQEKDNYLFVIKKIKLYKTELNLSVISYCLLPNHYHLLIRQDNENPADCCLKECLTVIQKHSINDISEQGRFLKALIKLC